MYEYLLRKYYIIRILEEGTQIFQTVYTFVSDLIILIHFITFFENLF